MARCNNVPKTKVNWGWCEEVAEGAREILLKQGIVGFVLKDDAELCVQDEVMHDSGWSHAWLWVDGRHYDSEARFGVRRWNQLPHFKRWERPDEEWDGIKVEPVLGQGEEEAMLRGSVRLWKAVVAPKLEELRQLCGAVGTALQVGLGEAGSLDL